MCIKGCNVSYVLHIKGCNVSYILYIKGCNLFSVKRRRASSPRRPQKTGKTLRERERERERETLSELVTGCQTLSGVVTNLHALSAIVAPQGQSHGRREGERRRGREREKVDKERGKQEDLEPSFVSLYSSTRI